MSPDRKPAKRFPLFAVLLAVIGLGLAQPEPLGRITVLPVSWYDVPLPSIGHRLEPTHCTDAAGRLMDEEDILLAAPQPKSCTRLAGTLAEQDRYAYAFTSSLSRDFRLVSEFDLHQNILFQMWSDKLVDKIAVYVTYILDEADGLYILLSVERDEEVE